jgi:hypothetical protein
MSMLLASIHAVLGILWLLSYATLITRVGDFFRRPRFASGWSV